MEYTNDLAEKSNIALSKKRNDITKTPGSPRNVSAPRSIRNQSISGNIIDQISDKIKGFFGGAPTPTTRGQRTHDDSNPYYLNETEQEQNTGEAGISMSSTHCEESGGISTIGNKRNIFGGNQGRQSTMSNIIDK